MFAHSPSRTVLLFGGGAGILTVLIALFIPKWTYFLIVAGFSTLIIAMLAAQFVYAWHMFKADEEKRKASMTTCRHCGNPIYKDDAVCPYCHEEVKN